MMTRCRTDKEVAHAIVPAVYEIQLCAIVGIMALMPRAVWYHHRERKCLACIFFTLLLVVELGALFRLAWESVFLSVRNQASLFFGW